MITYFQAIILGLLQGFSELFPVSSLGHSIIVPAIFRWDLTTDASSFVVFLVATHLATALVLVGFFWRDWLNIIKGILRSLWMRKIHPRDTEAKIGWLLIIGTIPAGLLGLILKKPLEHLFVSGLLVSFILILNGVILFLVEQFKTTTPPEGKYDDNKIAHLTFRQSLLIGLAQALALIPGFSRTGAALSGGLLNGLSHENAARFSFLLATPIILAAAVLELPKLFTESSHIFGQSLVGFICAGLTAYLSVRFLTKYFETKTMKPFAVYCVAAGILAIIFISL